jgi:hypothetical protein
MKTTLKNEIEKSLEVNMIDYSFNATSIINEVIRPITSVSEEQEQKISDILDLTQQEWDAAEVDAEGATKEQDAALDKIIEDAAEEIAALF